jgi:hypothetical protein
MTPSLCPWQGLLLPGFRNDADSKVAPTTDISNVVENTSHASIHNRVMINMARRACRISMIAYSIHFKSLVVYCRESSYKLIITCCRSAVNVLLHFGLIVLEIVMGNYTNKQLIKRKGIVQ